MFTCTLLNGPANDARRVSTVKKLSNVPLHIIKTVQNTENSPTAKKTDSGKGGMMS